MFETLEWTQSNEQQNIEQLLNPTLEETIKNHHLRTDNSRSHF